MKKPILLLESNLIKPLELALKRINDIKNNKIANHDEIIYEGLFILAVTSFENSILDTLKILFTHIPHKLDIKSNNIPKEILLDEKALEYSIEDKINSLGYKNIDEILDYFYNKTGLSNDLINSNTINDIKEIKATRNILIHNNLFINNVYKNTAGPHQRKSNNNKLLINREYLIHTINTIEDTVKIFIKNLSNKYKCYTKIQATRNLFNYLFNTPLLCFDDIFIFNYEQDYITGVNSKIINSLNTLSSSEKLLFNLWIAHFKNDPFEFKGSWLYHLSESTKNKLDFLISNIDLLKS